MLYFIKMTKFTLKVGNQTVINSQIVNRNLTKATIPCE